MITQNTAKKALVEKLLQDKSISLDDALVLLDVELPQWLTEHLLSRTETGTLPINPEQFRTICSGDIYITPPGSTCNIAN